MSSRAADRLAAWARPGAVAGLLATVALAVALWEGTRSYDDAYITFTYARSLAEGLGLTWKGALGLGTSSPFLALLLAGLERLAPLGVPVWAALGSLVAGLVAALGLAALGRREGWPLGGLAAGLFWLLWPGRWGHGGGEMPMAAAAVVAAAWAFAARRELVAGGALALAVALRAECGLAAPLLALAVVGRDGLARALRPVTRAAAVALALTLAWGLVLYRLAGTLVPRTLEAKRAQVASALGVWSDAGLELLLGQLRWLGGAATSALAFPLLLAVVGGVLLVRDRHAFALGLVGWGILHLGLLAAIGVPTYTWYLVPFHLALLLLAGLGVEAPVRAEVARIAPRATVVLLVVGTLAIGVRELVLQGRGDARRFSYGQVAALADRYPPGTRLAAYEVGYLGYFSRQPVVDLLGLTNPEVPLELVERGELAAIRELLAPGLLMLPLNGGSLLAATVGDVPAFLAGWRLDRLQLAGEPHLAVFRRVELAPRGEVELDLLPALALAGARVELAGHPGEWGLTLVLAPGERREIELPAGGPRILVLGLAAPSGPARAAVERSQAAQSVVLGGAEALLAPGWQRWEMALPASGADERLVFACAAETAVACWLGQPHLSRAE